MLRKSGGDGVVWIVLGLAGVGKVDGRLSGLRGIWRVGAGVARPRRDDGQCLNQPRRRGVAPPCHHPPQPPCRASPRRDSSGWSARCFSDRGFWWSQAACFWLLSSCSTSLGVR